jgi:hypothetical protein
MLLTNKYNINKKFINILSTILFYQRYYFINDIILSTILFYQRYYFINDIILSTILFYQRYYLKN